MVHNCLQFTYFYLFFTNSIFLLQCGRNRNTFAGICHRLTWVAVCLILVNIGGLTTVTAFRRKVHLRPDSAVPLLPALDTSPIRADHQSLTFNADATRWSHVQAVCNNHTHAQFTMPMHMWTRLKTQATLAAMSCRSSTFPLREGIRPYYASEYFPNKDLQEKHGYLLFTNPTAFSDLVAVLDVSRTCQLAADVTEYEANKEAEEGREVELSSPDYASLLNRLKCAKGDGRVGGREHATRSGRKLASGATSDGPLLGIMRSCRVHQVVGKLSALWAPLLGSEKDASFTSCKGEVEGGESERESASESISMDNIRQRAHCIPCGVVIPSATFFDLTTANYQALHHAPNTATLLYPEQVRAGILHPAPWLPNRPTVVLVQHT